MNRVTAILWCVAIWLGVLPGAARAQTLYALPLLESGWGAGVLPQRSGVQAGAAGRAGIMVDDGAGPAAGDALLLRLTPAQRVGLIRNTRGLTAVRLPNGAMMLDLAGRYREFAVAQVDPAGRARLGCVHGEQALLRALDPCAPLPPPLFEER